MIELARVAPPVIWELTRSFFYAEPSCVDGQYDEAKLKDYVGHYCNMAPLTQYDRDNLMKLYLYQLAVCDYYSQYFNANFLKKEEYLLQARFATKVLQHESLFLYKTIQIEIISQHL